MSGIKTGAYAYEIQEILGELFRGFTPFVWAEPLSSFANYVAYVNDGTPTSLDMSRAASHKKNT